MKNLILSLKNVTKTYGKDTVLKDFSLDIHKGELFALLGPNGAGKTTLIGCITGYVKKTSGSIFVSGLDVDKYTYEARKKIGLVPQELALDIFYTVEDVLKFQRGLYGKPHNQELLEKTLRSLSLWGKRNEEIRKLSGGMKRRVLIGKALMNEPEILFLDEPTAGVDVELRRGMWETITQLKQEGVTIILTTHYLEEAESMADRIGIINKGSLIALDSTKKLLEQFGEKRIDLHMDNPLTTIPQALSSYNFQLINNGNALRYFASKKDISPHTLLGDLRIYGINIKDIDTKTSSLEEIFLQLIGDENKKQSV
jgi:ABC-2 type transport system ATP-binding protein